MSSSYIPCYSLRSSIFLTTFSISLKSSRRAYLVLIYCGRYYSTIFLRFALYIISVALLPLLSPSLFTLFPLFFYSPLFICFCPPFCSRSFIFSSLCNVYFKIAEALINPTLYINIFPSVEETLSRQTLVKNDRKLSLQVDHASK